MVDNISLDIRPFPIQREHKQTEYGHVYLPSCTIPWWLAEVAYEYYASRYGKSQSLERLAERGGFGHYELLMLIRREEI